VFQEAVLHGLLAGSKRARTAPAAFKKASLPSAIFHPTVASNALVNAASCCINSSGHIILVPAILEKRKLLPLSSYAPVTRLQPDEPAALFSPDESCTCASRAPSPDNAGLPSNSTSFQYVCSNAGSTGDRAFWDWSLPVAQLSAQTATLNKASFSTSLLLSFDFVINILVKKHQAV
jgi:hypothetical protein